MQRVGVIGAGRFGRALCDIIVGKNIETIVLDIDSSRVQAMGAIVSKVFQGDSTNIAVLEEAGFSQCDAVVVAIGENIESSILTAMNLKELGIKKIVAKATSATHGKVLDKIGVDEIVFPNIERAERLARSLIAGTAVDYFDIGAGVSVSEFKVPEKYIGKALIDADLRSKHKLTILSIKRKLELENIKPEMIVNPAGSDVFRQGDTITVFGKTKDLDDVLKG
ncbi:MAG: TrkA family potassium uptake protein [Kiritimatiellae bacterium]|jgi:trk system potassium uptake protein TrkA|nr:TrkA family potassium uptake protein [Kiritimatiellia bacterium]